VSSVGENIDAYCLKCKLLLAHVVLFKVNGAVSRVKCKTCGAEHKYRGASKPVKKSDAPRPQARKTVASGKVAASKLSDGQIALQWDLKSRNRQPDAPILDYSIKASYKVNDVIHHPAFGVGFVEKLLSDKGMSVLFNDSVKLLAMNIG
jgi:hypothetical protein